LTTSGEDRDAAGEAMEVLLAAADLGAEIVIHDD
jgi:hypothetical protein